MRFEKFFGCNEKLGVHCEREQDAKLLCAMFDDAGYTWLSGKSYALDTNWDRYGNEIYYTNSREFGSMRFKNWSTGRKIISFREFLAEEFMSVLQSLKSLNLRGVITDDSYLLLINDALDAHAEFKEGEEI